MANMSLWKRSNIFIFFISILDLVKISNAFIRPEQTTILPSLKKGWVDYHSYIHSHNAIKLIQEPIPMITHTTANTLNTFLLGSENALSMDFVMQTEYDSSFGSVPVVITLGDEMTNLMGNIAIGAMIFIVLLASIAILFSTVIIPKAADKLEKQVNENYPDLLEE